MRPFWIAFGIATHALFAWTVVRLFEFLSGTSHGILSATCGLDALPWYVVDFMLAVQFSVVHSFLLWRRTREHLERFIPSPQYGCFFCTTVCLTLLVTIECWQPGPHILWNPPVAMQWLIRAGFLLTWPVLIYCLSLTGLGYQTGWTPWWAWVRGVELPPRKFEPRSVYRFLRHPIYLSFLSLLWLVPTASIDRAFLILLWTLYIFVGSALKDRRLLSYLGDDYRRYQARVPGYPWFLAGPLARIPFEEPASLPSAGRRAA